MKLAIAFLFVSLLCYADDQPKPPPTPSPQVETISADAAELSSLQLIEVQEGLLAERKDRLRIQICWRLGLEPGECGQWVQGTPSIRKLPKPGGPAKPESSKPGTK